MLARYLTEVAIAMTGVDRPPALNFVLAGYAYSTGNLLFDDAVAAALKIQEASGRIHQGVLGYVRTVDFFGLTGRVGVIVPLAVGRWEGIVADTFATVSREGFADPRLLFSIGFIGAPALGGREFVSYRERAVVGASLQVIAPLDQYDPARLITPGSNRWSFKPRVGMSYTRGHWTLKLYGSVWLFTDNPDALGQRIEQDPIYSLEGHGIYSFRPGLWLAVNAGAPAVGRVWAVRSRTTSERTHASAHSSPSPWPGDTRWSSSMSPVPRGESAPTSIPSRSSTCTDGARDSEYRLTDERMLSDAWSAIDSGVAERHGKGSTG